MKLIDVVTYCEYDKKLQYWHRKSRIKKFFFGLFTKIEKFTWGGK